MSLKWANRVRETSTSTGTGALNLDGAVTGFRTCVAGIGDNNTAVLAVEMGADWEIGIWTIDDASPDTITPVTTIDSSTGSKINWGAGTKTVRNVLPAEYAGGPKVLDVKVASSSASLDFVTGFSTRYDWHEIRVMNLVPQTDAANLLLQFSTDGGGNWQAGSTDYIWAIGGNRPGSSTFTGTVDTGDPSFQIGPALGSATGEGYDALLHFPNLQSALYKSIGGHLFFYGATPDTLQRTMAGTWKQVTAVNGIRLIMSSGNITSGKAVLTGYPTIT